MTSGRGRSTLASVALLGALLSLATCGENGGGSETAGRFDECVARTGEPYREALRLLVARPDIAEFLTEAASRFGPSTPEGRVVGILRHRRSHPEVFRTLAALLQEKREVESLRAGTRPGLLEGSLRKFMKGGPESRVVRVRGERRLTDVGWQREWKEEVRFTEEEVTAGIERNVAARYAVLEHILKFFDEGTDYERIELLSLFRERPPMKTWGEEAGNRADLYRRILADETKSWPVRVMAAILLPANGDAEAREVLLQALSSAATADEGTHRRYLLKAAGYLAAFGGAEDLARLRALEPKAPWERGIVADAADRLAKRLEETRGE